MNEFDHYALDAAAKSPCTKRKVGAVLVVKKEAQNTELFTGYNYHPSGERCEYEDGSTKDEVIHAEISALDKFTTKQHNVGVGDAISYTLYVTHSPCAQCHNAIAEIELNLNIDIDIEVVEQFMKFDTDKLRYDLIPPSWIELDAEVLTKGAKKYKPNNWKQIDPAEIMRYYSATLRHMQDWKKFMDGHPDGHLFDDGEMGINTHHLANARTNLGFLLTLTETLEKAEEVKNGIK